MTDAAVLTIDVELFTQTPAYRGAVGETDAHGVGLSGAEYLLDALADRDAKATCFVVSSLAERYPDVVRAFSDAGHEIASHSHRHERLSTLDGDARVDELERSRRLLERITGGSVSGFRAPAFDVPREHFDGLAAAGYRYDSSVVPSRSIPGWYGGDHDLHRPAPARRVQPGAPAGIAELPVSVSPVLRLPLTGAWLRFFGPRYAIAGMTRLASQGIAPVLYVHPWELVELPAVEGVPARVYWRTGAWMRRAIDRILEQPFEFVTARSVVEGTIAGSQRNPAGRNDRGVPSGGG